MLMQKSRNKSPASSSAGNRLYPATHVVRAVHGTQTVLLDPKRGRYHALDEVGQRIWELVADNPTADGLVAKMLEESSSTRAEIEARVCLMLMHLQSNRLLEIT